MDYEIQRLKIYSHGHLEYAASPLQLTWCYTLVVYWNLLTTQKNPDFVFLKHTEELSDNQEFCNSASLFLLFPQNTIQAYKVGALRGYVKYKKFVKIRS